ncbi:glycosyltransferase family 2 protein [Paenibacillus sp. NPDC058177]|uniref:glycosyltransferase family 2 protein n=1 Tax=Paenibacillus sp. NPDC058177 TaxID=3346369 RepID=UPI0036DEA4A3
MLYSQPKVSIIVIVSDTEQYIEKCLDSLINQTIDEKEIIVVDDRSTTDIRPLLQKYIDELQIKFIQLEEKLGPGGARNAGLLISTGKYIAFCDSDDWLDLHFYEVAVQHMERESADIGMCGLVRDYGVEMKEKVYKCKYDSLIALTGEVAFKIMTKQYDYGINIVPSSVNRVYNRNFLICNNLRFIENVYYEDLLFSWKALLATNKLLCIPSVYYHHYKRIGSIVQSFSQKHINDFYTVFSEISQHLKDINSFEKYKFNYYKFGEHFFNLIIRQIFEYVHSDLEKKMHMKEALEMVKRLIDFDEYLEYVTAEKLRQHIQPNIQNTNIL